MFSIQFLQFLQFLLTADRRVGQTAAQHGIRVTTLYTDPDNRSQHALSSPFAFNLGSVSAYLDGDHIIEIAKAQGCQGIHPGYGFVSTAHDIAARSTNQRNSLARIRNSRENVRKLG